MLRNLIVKILSEEIKKEFTNIFSSQTEPISRGNTMIDTPKILFYSPKEQRILDYIAEKRSAKKADIIEYFKNHEDSINATTIAELFANLAHRKAIINGPNGYTIAG